MLPSMAFWGIPPISVLTCMGALPAATLRTVKKKGIGLKWWKFFSGKYYALTIYSIFQTFFKIHSKQFFVKSLLIYIVL